MYVLVWRLRRGVLLLVVGLVLAISLLAAGGGPAGPLRLAVPEPLLPQATRLVRSYLESHPEGQVELLPVPGEEAAAGLVRSGEAEAALVRGALAAGGSPDRKKPRWAARLALTTVGWEAVVAASGPFLPSGGLASTQVRTLLTGKPLEWGAVVAGLTGRVNLYHVAGSGTEPLLAEFLGMGGARGLRPGRTVSGSASLRQELFADRTGLALVPSASLPAGLKVWPIDGFLPTPQDLAAGRYPLARPIYLATLQGFSDGRTKELAAMARLLSTGGDERRVTLFLAGDFLPDGPVGAAAKTHGPEWPWNEVKSTTGACDLAFLNLEAPLSEIGWKIGAYRGDPAAVRGLRAAGIDVLALANDHILDYDEPGLLSTLALLDREGIAHAGAGATLDLARKPAILERKGMKVAFLSYGRPEQGITTTGRRWEASPWSPGIAPAGREEVAEDVRRVAAGVDAIVVAVHWGEDGAELPRPEDRLLARAAIDAGARVVVGFGSGVPQGVEVYREGLILYGLGGFLRDEPEESRRQLGLAARVTLAGGSLADLELLPVWNEGGRSRILQGQGRRDALLLLAGRTKSLSQVGETTAAPNPDAKGGPTHEQQQDHRNGSPNPRTTRRLLPPAVPPVPDRS